MTAQQQPFRFMVDPDLSTKIPFGSMPTDLPPQAKMLSRAHLAHFPTMPIPPDAKQLVPGSPWPCGAEYTCHAYGLVPVTYSCGMGLVTVHVCRPHAAGLLPRKENRA